MSIKGFPITKCARRGCHHNAQFIPVFNIPAKSILIMQNHTGEVYRAHMNLPLCKKHGDDANVQDFASEKLAAMFIAQAKAQNKPPPDFERAYVTIESMSEPGYQAILKSEADKKKGLVLQ